MARHRRLTPLSELVKAAQQPGKEGEQALTRLQDFIMKRYRPQFERAADWAELRYLHGRGRYPYFVIFSVRREEPHFDVRSASVGSPPSIEAHEIVVWSPKHHLNTHRFVEFTQPPRKPSTWQRRRPRFPVASAPGPQEAPRGVIWPWREVIGPGTPDKS